ncbi:MAG: glycoside hydrolase family 88 protein [Spirochaetales bacterium]|nr:glycoside hydrolase family 88 protein [Spirochaetales bacterium]
MKSTTETSITHKEALSWAVKACDAIMKTYTPKELPPAGGWHYHQGVFLLGMIRLWHETGDNTFFEYTKEYTDTCIDADGKFEMRPGELDSIMAGMLLFPLYEKTNDKRYKIAMDTLIHFWTGWKKNSIGGYWHKDIYPNQMWLDGIYMQGPFAVNYAKLFDKPAFYDEVAKQAILMYENILDEKTGLLRHAWDESRQVAWADPQTGLSPEHWGRAMGWYPVAVLDILDVLPADHKDRKRLEAVFIELMKSLVKYQEPETGLWYQVLDKGDRADNWLETSCTSLFVYAYAKGVRTGLLGSEYMNYAESGFRGMTSKAKENGQGILEIEDICIGTGVGDYIHYINRPRKTNDLHGVGAFALSCIEFAHALK